MGLTLSITPNNTDQDSDTSKLGMTYGFEKIVTPKCNINKINYTLTLVDVSFNKQMYQPGEINARIQFAPQPEIAFLKSRFLNSTVSLSRGDNDIATNYYVHELTPEYSSSSSTLYVNFKIFSPDKKLTLKSDCQVFVSKRLGEDILKGNSTIDVTISLKNGLVYENNQEYLQPYLVQYNESFYDMLVRTANRWGEFVYYEGDKLILGHDTVTSTDTQLKNYVSASYVKTNGESIADNCAKAVTTDDYLAAIKRKKPENQQAGSDTNSSENQQSESDTNSSEKQQGEYILQAGDMYANDAVYKHKVLQRLFNMKGNVFDWVLNTFADDGITAAQNKCLLDYKEKTYNDTFFEKPLEETKDSNGVKTGLNAGGESVEFLKLHYGEFGDNTKKTDPCSCRQFATYENDGGLTNVNYRNVLAKELLAGQETICVDMDDDDNKYQHLLLGDVFYIGNDLEKYLVTRIECFVDDVEKLVTESAETVIGNKIEKVITSVEIKHTKKIRYRVYAVKQISKGVFYPPMLPSGHIRFSGPQRGIVKDTLDPMLNGRYRVQTFGTELSPWLRVSREMVKGASGAVWQLEKDTEVLLDFDDGNVELPYIVGALQNTKKRSNNRHAMFNTMDFTTPSGHAIRLSDGEGGGAANFTSSFIPLVSWIKDFYPQYTGMQDFGGYSKYYEGGMDLTDKFGIYSIKASTDKRNISINSPYGTVNLNAFTGITISAPNGDVKIQGKNVSIEAGNKISITSGKNIAQGILGSGVLLGGNRELNGGAIISDVLNAIGKKAADWLDLSIVRDAVEVVLRPINGSLQIKSYRSMLLQAGLKMSDNNENVQIDQNNQNNQTEEKAFSKWVLKNWSVSDLYDDYLNRKNDKDAWSVPDYGSFEVISASHNQESHDVYDIFGHSDTGLPNNGNQDQASVLNENIV